MRVITPENYKTTPWKNGQGETIELAISEGGTLNDFDWRLSMASVTTDGPFSNFAGYDRCLILLEGNGMDLEHDKNTLNSLSSAMQYAEFSGGSDTTARLHNGPITDFNLMTRSQQFAVTVKTSAEQATTTLETVTFRFIYNAGKQALTYKFNENQQDLPANHLLVVNSESSEITVNGSNYICISLGEKTQINNTQQ